LITAFRRLNVILAIVLLVVVAILGLSLSAAFVAALFRFGPLHFNDIALTLAAGAIVLIALELLKPIWRARLLG
jgi:Ca2+-transporting ATPase